MALQFQVVPINFGQGVDTKTNEKLVVPGKLTELKNAVFTEGGTISKRNGYTQLGTATLGGGAPIGPSNALPVFAPDAGVNELIQIGDNSLYSYANQAQEWVEKDPCYSVKLDYKTVYRDADRNLNSDKAVNGNYEAYTWSDLDAGRSGLSIVDTVTGNQILLRNGFVPLAATNNVSRVVAIGTYFYFFYIKATNEIAWKRVDITSPSVLSAETVVASTAAASTKFDVVVADGFIWLVYENTTPTISIAKISSAGAVSATATIAEAMAATTYPTISVSTNVFVYWVTAAGGLRYAVFDAALASVLAATTIDATVPSLSYIYDNQTAVATSATAQTIFYGVRPDIGQPYNTYLNVAEVDTAGVVTAPSVLIRSLQCGSKAFVYNGDVYLWALHESTLQSTFFLVRKDGAVLAKALPGTARIGVILSSVIVSGSSASFAPSVITQLEANFYESKSGIINIFCDFASAKAFNYAQLGKNLHITGGYLSIYDGRSVVESGFHLLPENISVGQTANPGGIEAGVHQYAVVYSWLDNYGQLHRSAPSIPVSVSNSANSENEIIVDTLRVTSKTDIAGECTIEVYRTEAGGTIFYNIKDNAANPTFNDTTVDTITIVDDAADTAIISNEILYTTGGVLENIAPESCSLIDVYQNRMVLAGLPDPLEFAYSKVNISGEGVAFSDLFTTRVDPLGGEISAIRLMDDKIIIFKENTIFYVSGDGPNDTGTANNYSIPALVTSDSGCPFPKSTVLMPLGIMYKSNKGIYLLTRGLQVQYIGAEVEDFNAQTIRSSELLQDKNQVRFLTDSGVTLVYDYFYQQWSTFTNHEGVDANVWKGSYVYLRNDGSVYKETTTFQDVSTNVGMKAVTAWLKMAGIQGFQRVRKIAFLAGYKSAHTLRVRVYYDYNNATYTEYNFDATTVIASSTVPYQFRLSLARQKCEAIKIEIEDTAGAGLLQESYNISDLSLEVGLKGGLNKLKSAQSI